MRTPAATLLYVGFVATLILFCVALLYFRSFDFYFGTAKNSTAPVAMSNRHLSTPVEIEARKRKFRISDFGFGFVFDLARSRTGGGGWWRSLANLDTARPCPPFSIAFSYVVAFSMSWQ